MKYSEFKSLIEKTYAGKFPRSFCKVYINRFSTWSNIGIKCYLAKSEKECVSGYFDNDPFNVCFSIELPTGFNPDTDDLPENAVMECGGNYYHIKPVVDTFLYYERRKIQYRKTAGTPEKLVQVFGKFVGKLHDSLADDVKNNALHVNHAALAAEKIA